MRKLTLVLAVAASLALAIPAGAAVPKDFFGLVSEDAFTGSAAYRENTMSLQSSLGVGLVRQTFHWKQIETRPGVYDFSAYDSYVAAAARHGLRILPILFDPPRFRAPVSRRTSATYPPRRYATMGTFGAAVARRYGPTGTFWADNPSVPSMPITAYQIWNEPNIPAYWPSGPNPRQYARLLKATRAGIRRVDRKAEIVSAGMPDSHLSRPHDVYWWVRAMLRAGARRSIDTLAVNPYGRSRGALMRKVERFRSILDHAHLRKVAIRVTEFGWSDVGPRSSFRVGRSGQAREIRTAIPALARARHRLRIRGLVYYDWRDAAPYPPAYRDFWGLHTGILSRGGAAKPALRAFRAGIAAAR